MIATVIFVKCKNQNTSANYYSFYYIQFSERSYFGRNEKKAFYFLVKGHENGMQKII